MQMVTDSLRRRRFIALLGGAIVWPLAAHARQPPRRIGFISGGVRPASIESGMLNEFLRGMRELGYVEGRDFVMEWRFAETRYEHFAALARDLVQLNVDVIVLSTGNAVRPTQRVTPTIPIVMAASADPVGTGLVDSLARPGGNTTGLSSAAADTIPKLFELLKMAVPDLSRLAILVNPRTRYPHKLLENAEAAAQSLGIALARVEADRVEKIEEAFIAMSRERVHALIVTGEPFLLTHRRKIAQLARQHRLPSICWYREYVEAGGLMSYGERLADHLRRAAYFVDKIFKGAAPADLPIEQPTRFYLSLNRKTADAIGLTISPQLLALADDVIE
jgi:putative ABC transport system substrate-binding protein